MRDVARDLCDTERALFTLAYQKPGLRLTHHPGRNPVQATVSPKAANISKWSVSEGGAHP
jgi:hypothetical protein